MSILRKLSRPALSSLAEALDSGRLSPPFPRSELRHHVPVELLAEVVAELQEMDASGMTVEHVSRLLRAVVTERSASQDVADRVELVWSGTAEAGSMSRDTSVVVQELFRAARRSVLISSYAVDKGEKAKTLFGPLAQRMDEDMELSVRFFLNVHRDYGDETADSILLRQLADSFRHEIWPGERLPEVFHDPRSLAVGGQERACLHAKCIVVDDERALVSSANFTEAAHERNIEAGLLIRDRQVASALRAQFETLVERGALVRVAVLPPRTVLHGLGDFKGGGEAGA